MIINNKLLEAIAHQVNRINRTLHEAGESYYLNLKSDIEVDQLHLEEGEILINYRISSSSSASSTIDNSTEFFDSSLQLTCYFLLFEQDEDYAEQALKVECIFSALIHALQTTIEETSLIEDYSKANLPSVYCKLVKAPRVVVSFAFQSSTIVNNTTLDNNVFVFMIENRYKSTVKPEIT